MKRHAGMPDGFKHVHAAPPPCNWPRNYSPKRERRAERRMLDSQATQYHSKAEDALERGLIELAEKFRNIAAAASARAHALFGIGATHKTNRALRRTV